MPTREATRSRGVRILASTLALLGSLATAAYADDRDFGRAATTQEIAAVNIDVKPNGSGLPAGSGTSALGDRLYAAQCAACHGNTGIEGPRDRLVGGRGSLATAKPLKTVGSYWQYAPTLYDYINRAMPFTAPGTLRPDEVYSLVAFLLQRNGVITESEIMDRTSLPLVQMPNRNGFAVEPAFQNLKRK